MSEQVFSDDLLEGSFDIGTICRGRDYWKKGKVQKIVISPDGSNVKSLVEGSRGQKYTTDIDFYEDGVSGACTCYMDYNCKHVAATVFALQAKSFDPTLLLSSVSTTKSTSKGVSKAFEDWFLEFKQTLTNEKQELLAPIKNEHHLLYILRPDWHDSPRFRVELKLAKLLKRGGYGKSKNYQGKRYNHEKHLSTIDEEIVYGLEFMNRDSYFNSDYLFLKGYKSSQWLKEMINTGRCYWEDVAGVPMSLGEDKSLDMRWELESDGSQELKTYIGEALAQIFVLDELWSVSSEQGTCHLVKTDIPKEAIKKLLNAPKIPPTASQQALKKLKAVVPKHSELMPQKLEKAIEKKDIDLVPVIRLNINEFYVQRSGWVPDNESDKVELPTAEIIFDYEGIDVPLSPNQTQEQMSYVKDRKLHTFKRNLQKEREHLSYLSQYIEFDRSRHQGVSGGELLIIKSIQDAGAMLLFVMETLVQLELSGWRVIRGHSAYQEVLHEDDVSWYSELDEESSYDYFGFTMGIMIGEEKINVLPIVAQMIKNAELDALQNLPDDQTVPLGLPNGKILAIPYGRIKPIINILVELYDTELSDGDVLKLSKQQAALLFEIEKAYQASKMRWLGGDKLRKLGNKLANFTAIEAVMPPKTFKATLRHYQQEGVNWLQFLREYQMGGILADDMGLGKTVQTLAHLSIEKNKRRMKHPSLLIAPTSLMVNWRLEAERFTPNLKVLVFHGDDRHQYKDRLTDYDVVLTTYPLLVRDKEELLEQEFYYLILDEAQFIKNHKAKSTQIVHQIKAAHRLCLTGTPMENHLGELWSLFHFLMPGLLGDNKQFSKLFRTPIEKHNDSERRRGLAMRVKPFMLRRHKEDVATELPEKTEILRSVELLGPQRDLYESIRLSMEKKVRDAIKKNGLARSHIIILDALLKLRQTCCDPKLLKLTSAKKAHNYSGKMALLMDLLPNLVEEGRKILLFSQFTTMLGIIEDALKQAKLDYVKLTGSTKNRSKPIEAFQQGKVPIFLISLKAGGTGLNLTAADTVIHYDPWWNPAVEDQATDRAHRIGQDKAVFVYKLLASGTVEETIQEMQQKKRSLMEGLFSDKNRGKLDLGAKELAHLFKPIDAD